MDDQFKDLMAMYLEDFQAGRLNCSETVLITMCNGYDDDMNVCPMIATAFGGGICGKQGLCGAVSGALMVIGLRHGRELGGDKTAAYELGKKFIAWFEQTHSTTICRDLIQMDLSDPDQMKAFRAPGGKHESVCQKLVSSACEWLAENL